MNSINIKDDYLKIVKKILRKHLPNDAKIWVFGSRVTGNAKKYSDLDLAIDLGKPISLDLMAILVSDFEESILPYKVDIIDWTQISDTFRSKIQSQCVALN